MNIHQTKTGRYAVKLDFYNHIVSGGYYGRKKEAERIAKSMQRKLKRLEKFGIDNCGKYEPQFENH